MCFIYEEKSDRIFLKMGISRKPLKKRKSGTKQPKGKFLEQRSCSGEKDSAIIHTHTQKSSPKNRISFCLSLSCEATNKNNFPHSPRAGTFSPLKLIGAIRNVFAVWGWKAVLLHFLQMKRNDVSHTKKGH